MFRGLRDLGEFSIIQPKDPLRSAWLLHNNIRADGNPEGPAIDGAATGQDEHEVFPAELLIR